MIIAVDTEELQDEPGNFLKECLKRMMLLAPQHTFILLSTKNVFNIFNGNINYSSILLTTTNNSIYAIRKINAVLKEKNASLFITANRFYAAFVKTTCCFLNPSFKSFAPQKTKGFFSKKLLKLAYKKAGVICCAWQAEKDSILSKYNISPEKIQVIHFGLEHLPVSEQNDSDVLKYSDGSAYFFLPQSLISANEIIIFLRAFSIFKKKFKSAMKLLVYSKDDDSSQRALKAPLKNFRFKDDVIFVKEGITSSKNIYRQAYAILFKALNVADGFKALSALAVCTPAICIDELLSKEIFGDSAFYLHYLTAEQIAGHMILVYKDEDQKNAFALKEHQRHTLFSWDASAQLLLQTLEMTCC